MATTDSTQLLSATQLSLFAAHQEPDAWTVRISARARRLAVRVYPAGRVEVVVPRNASARMVQQFVSRHRQWIDERVRESALHQALLAPPQEILLPAVERCIQVEYRHASQGDTAPRLRAAAPERLQVRGTLDEPKRWSRLFTRWLMNVAQHEFTVRLTQLAELHGFSFERVQIRRQRTRWGSCSSHGTISLNVCGLFVRPEVLRYLLIHELCHTRHMNHSRAFWKLVASCEPEYRVLDRELSRAWRQVPAWMFIG